MKKIILLLTILIILFSCEIESNKIYEIAGYVISVNSDETLTFYGLAKKWEKTVFYIPDSIVGHSVTKLAYDDSSNYDTTWDGCTKIYIPSTVNSIENRTFYNHSNSLSSIYWDRQYVYSASFVPSGVILYVKNQYGNYISW